MKFELEKDTNNASIYDECQTQSAKVWALSQEQAHQDDSNDTSKPIYECQVDFPVLGIILILSKGNLT